VALIMVSARSLTWRANGLGTTITGGPGAKVVAPGEVVPKKRNK
jgi:hypothetical protein